MEKLVNFVIGAPGAGKSLLCKTAKTCWNIHWVSVSKLILADKAINKLELVDDLIVIKFLNAYLESSVYSRLNIDGFPRTIPQALAAIQMVQHKSIKSSVILLNYANIDKEVIWNCINKRRVCDNCGYFTSTDIVDPLNNRCIICNGGNLNYRFKTNSDFEYRMNIFNNSIGSILDIIKINKMNLFIYQIDPCYPDKVKSIVKLNTDDQFT